MKTGMGGQKKKNVRSVKNIMHIEQKVNQDGLQNNKFEIFYRLEQLEPTEEEEKDRDVPYECENVETASYIVSKIKTQM